ncbi:putative tRNA (guanine-N(1)-)-methyltransferase, mitochondrial [Glarea lozoyensis 74030]|uniref:Putative tRNA (Guanine-N(1)-)-methyltransferase, mitochondrial n=1 Tax=Glarea lozoyensis (strain ATCC 74030 / MF5533) TaxID=1104152 RepID=H0ERS6_GLAL7|nr:putative tRNA (guanine-N(1)-)-methyltransferase, mitochondrial [Glarea lozoyensis 74030]
MTGLLPEDALGEVPVGFAIVGHVVINKIDDVGAASEFRTFSYEVLAGPDDMNVELSEGNCIGPFAVPAGKKGVFVWANDLNPDSYEALKDAIARNKVSTHIRPFCQDGHTFIPHAADSLLALTQTNSNIITLPAKRPRNPSSSAPLPAPKTLTLPPTISHFILNLPAIAISFLPSLIGLYASSSSLFAPHTTTKLPLVHVHCFSTKSEDNIREGREIAERISKEIGYEMRAIEGEGDVDEEGMVRITEVRDVAPKKRMFCASFRVPRDVAFRERVVKV